jgi:hypothetical protein
MSCSWTERQNRVYYSSHYESYANHLVYYLFFERDKLSDIQAMCDLLGWYGELNDFRKEYYKKLVIKKKEKLEHLFPTYMNTESIDDKYLPFPLDELMSSQKKN